jgi:hypothetical protein
MTGGETKRTGSADRRHAGSAPADAIGRRTALLLDVVDAAAGFPVGLAETEGAEAVVRSVTLPVRPARSGCGPPGASSAERAAGVRTKVRVRVSLSGFVPVPVPVPALVPLSLSLSLSLSPRLSPLVFFDGRRGLYRSDRVSVSDVGCSYREVRRGVTEARTHATAFTRIPRFPDSFRRARRRRTSGRRVCALADADRGTCREHRPTSVNTRWRSSKRSPRRSTSRPQGRAGGR